jgi:copper chaperone
MQQIFRIEGMHCGGCVARVTRALKPLADEVEVTLDPPRITLDVSEVLSTETVQAAVAAAGDYVVSSE